MKKFRQELAECTEQQRVEIYHLWGLDGLSDKGPQKRPDILLKRITDPIAARFVWEHLTPGERQVLYRMLGHSARSGTPRQSKMWRNYIPFRRAPKLSIPRAKKISPRNLTAHKCRLRRF